LLYRFLLFKWVFHQSMYELTDAAGMARLLPIIQENE
jgi:hypothetical protein